jgi:N utilization substance protein B
MGERGPRRQAREAALQVLYAADLKSELRPGEIKRAFDEVAAEFSLPSRARERAQQLCTGVAENLERIDAALERACTHWKVERLAAVDRNVLRIAAFELLCEDGTPPEVVIDEAVEVARRFAGDASPAFVNGVLDALVREQGGAAT